MQYYGRRAPVRNPRQGRDALFDIDYRHSAVREKMRRHRDRVHSAASMKELRARLERRAEDSRDVIERRLENARKKSRAGSI